jgi:excisionase family DNA binding protein
MSQVIVITPDELSALLDEKLKPLLKQLAKGNQPEPVLSKRVGINEAAKIIGRSKATIYRLTSANEMPFEKHGSRLVFDADQLKVWASETARQ